jgi:hypothetical protein
MSPLAKLPTGFPVWARIGFGLWVVYLLLVALFYPTGGDEPGYFYSALQMAEGKIPVVDFFALQPPLFFAPYTLVARFFSPAIEAARLVSVTSIVAVTAMVTLMAARSFGRTFGILAFLMMGFSHFWFYWNVQVIHYSISNLAMVAGFYILFTGLPGRRTWFLAGLAAGWMANARLILAPVALCHFYLCLRAARARDGASWRSALVEVAPAFIVAGVIMSLPTLALLVLDPQAWLFDFLTARAGVEAAVRWQGQDSWETVLNFLKMRWGATYTLFFWIDDTLKATVNNCILFVPLILAGWNLWRAGPGARLRWRSEVKADPLITGSGWMVAGVFGIHYLTVLSAPYYLQGSIPFMTLGSLGLLAKALELREAGARRNSVCILAACLIPVMAYFLFWTGAHLIRRNEPSNGRPVASALVGCWLEQNTAADEIVMSYGTLPVSLAGRHLPHGFEYNNGISWMFWAKNLPEETARRFHIFRGEDYLQLLRTDALRVIVDDRHLESELKRIPEAAGLIAEKYRTLWTTGGAFPYTVLIHKSAWRDDLPRVAPMGRSSLALKELGQGSMAAKVRLALGDVSQSVVRLPHDVASAVARLVHAPYERRCRDYLASSR